MNGSVTGGFRFALNSAIKIQEGNIMCTERCPLDLNPHEYKAYREIEEQIGRCAPGEARGMYDISEGVMGDYILMAVVVHIDRGHVDLLAEFPELALSYFPNLPY